MERLTLQFTNDRFTWEFQKGNQSILSQQRIRLPHSNLVKQYFNYFYYLKESDPTTLHCARLLLLLSGVSFQLIPNMGMNKHRVRDRKILSSTVEVMEVSECEEDFHISDGNLSEDGQVEVNAYGSPIAALDRAQDIVRGGQALVATDENIVRVA